MKVALLFDDVTGRQSATPDELGVLEAVQAVEAALRERGHRVSRVPAGTELSAWTRRLAEAEPDLVFNLCEGLGGLSEGEVLAARAVEELGFAMTGSPSGVLDLARRKDEVNRLLEKRGLPVPPWAVWDGFNRDAWVAEWNVFPAIVKPVAEDASVGITQSSVVSDRERLSRRMLEVADLAPLMVQAFVGSREVNAGIVGRQVLPLSEILFDDLPAGHHPIVGYAAKWSPGSPEDRGTRPVCPAHLDSSLSSRIRQLAMDAWEAVGGSGYGRVDFRLDDRGQLHVLEVNANPDLAPSAGLARMATAHGWSYAELVEGVLRQAFRPLTAAAGGGR